MKVFVAVFFAISSLRAGPIVAGKISAVACATTVEGECGDPLLSVPNLVENSGIGSASAAISFTPFDTSIIGSSAASVSATGLVFHGMVEAVSPPDSIDNGRADASISWEDVIDAQPTVLGTIQDALLAMDFVLHIDQSQGDASSTISFFESVANQGSLTYSTQNGLECSDDVTDCQADGNGNFTLRFIGDSSDPQAAKYGIILTWELGATAAINQTSRLDATDTLQATSISLVDANGNPVCCATLSAESGLSYPFVNSQSAVPEPGTIALIGSGLLLLPIRRRFQRLRLASRIARR